MEGGTSPVAVPAKAAFPLPTTVQQNPSSYAPLLLTLVLPY